MHTDPAIHHDARSEAIEPAIQSRVLRIGRPAQRWFHHALLLTSGNIHLARSEGPATIVGPAIALFPPSAEETITVAAGSRGYLFGASPEILGEAIGEHAESAALRVFSAGFSVNDALEPTSLREMIPLFEGALAELATDGRASRMVISAYMRLILMTVWRLQRSPAAGEQRASAGSILQRFRQSVEISFRRHRSISDYAAELGITTDRLHAICQRTLSRSPIELVHDRLVQEAKQRLERSARDVQEISYSLGFRDPGNFSHFFKRKTGMSPARYRAMAIKKTSDAPIQTSSDYHDWP
ncbi:helix-turn-helix domain-containing protein [Pseudaminobacter soli (ex Li et al. 2025)]|uniref:AraC family transcriptional regulator n=1 Tax=Pseudaminobacter soli (ex Li et al. 2025) TaxID=1295366 RepID=A0A2P7RLG8_9HYPH|nr:helix-turn-helix transcriptional regulator [Mesorhizobium soli]PSJ51053.1 AraC family transcriptional regulator [Mesorhizobium soli]